MLGIERFSSVGGVSLVDRLVPPQVPALGPFDRNLGAAHHQNVLDRARLTAQV
ncbi:Uncharacterised protein [Mycobacteroides abscessus subsp. abscessus]|nr:Uncharacterised protein [Mycobacteroides abscessus subsp. abscessus]